MEQKFLNRFLPLSTLICSIMVVGIHSYNAGNIEKMSFTSRIEGFFAHGLFMSAVPIFFFISGYLFYRNVNEMNDIYRKIKRRLKSVVIPFLAWSTIYYLFYAIASNIFSLNVKVDISISGIIKGIVFYEYVFPMWFMFMLIIFIMMAPLIFLILCNKRFSKGIFIITLILSIFSIEANIVIDGEMRLLFAFNYFFYYFGGALFAKYVKNLTEIIEKIDKIPFSLIIVEIFSFSLLETLIYDEIIPMMNTRMFVPFIAIGVLFLLVKCSNKIFLNTKISTMIIYSIHPMIGTIIVKALNVIEIPKLVAFFFFWAMNVVVSCIVSIIIQKIKPLNIVLNGNR